jgi:hypothetical protein
MTQRNMGNLLSTAQLRIAYRWKLVIYATSLSRANSAHKILRNVLRKIKIIFDGVIFLSKPSGYSAERCLKGNTVADRAGIKSKIADIWNSWLPKLRLARESCTSRLCKLDNCLVKTTHSSGPIPIQISTSCNHYCETNIIVT